MSSSEEIDLSEFLGGGRQLLHSAAEIYGRSLSPEEFWWLGVALAATTLAEMDGKSFAVNRLEQLVDRLGYKGVRGDWLQRFVEELAELNAEGLLWPLYRRAEAGPVVLSGAALSGQFDAEAAYFLALGHIGVALAVHHGKPELVSDLSEAIVGLVQAGRSPAREAEVLRVLQAAAGQ